MIDRVAARLGRRAGRGAGRLQVVRRRAARRLARLRRRGERGRVVPAPRRHGVDHRQGRHHPGPARGGDHWRRPAAIPASSTPSSTRELGAPVYERIDAPATPEQKARAARLSRRATSRATELAGEPITAHADDGAGQRRRHRRPEGRHRRTAGSRRARRAPKTSTSSTPRASAAASTCGGSRRRRGPSWPRRWRERCDDGRQPEAAGVLENEEEWTMAKPTNREREALPPSRPCGRAGSAVDRRLLAGLQLPRVGMIYLQENPLLQEPLRPSTSSTGCSATGARARPGLRLDPSEPADQASTTWT